MRPDYRDVLECRGQPFLGFGEISLSVVEVETCAINVLILGLISSRPDDQVDVSVVVGVKECSCRVFVIILLLEHILFEPNQFASSLMKINACRLSFGASDKDVIVSIPIYVSDRERGSFL